MIETQTSAVIGRITEIQLPDRDRLSVEPERSEHNESPNPIGMVRLLGSVDLDFSISSRGISEPPRVGDYVYLAHPQFMRFAVTSTRASGATISVGHLSGAPETKISLPIPSIFGRHCAVLGSTGGGKSWSTASLVEQIANVGGKVILLDPTGEYHALDNGVSHVHLGGQRTGSEDKRRFVSFPFRHLNEMDLFAIFQPSPGIQAPKLRDALESLKLIHLEPALANEGLLFKAGVEKKPINSAILKHDAAIHAASADYDFSKLSRQIFQECVNPQGADKMRYGQTHDFSHSSCVSLCMRIESVAKSAHLAPIFSPPDYMEDLTSVISSFFADVNAHVLRISMQHLSFEHSTRELVVNSIGRYLLSCARAGMFQAAPVVVAIDEAHQFLSKNIGDETNKVYLDAFGIIAKEGRKYGLTCLLATQRPRDIPEDVLSQIGMLIVHRLVNERDQAVVINASGLLDGTISAFLPSLRDGEALLVSNDSILPVPIAVRPPSRKPNLPENAAVTWMNGKAE